MPIIKRSDASNIVGLKYGFRSGLEDKVSDQLLKFKVAFTYESEKIKYSIPEKVHSYTPDFVLIKKNGEKMFIETKGRFLTADRQKHVYIKEQFPELDIRFIFTNALQKIRKGSQTTYADWCNKFKFKFATKAVPTEWLMEVK